MELFGANLRVTSRPRPQGGGGDDDDDGGDDDDDDLLKNVFQWNPCR